MHKKVQKDIVKVIHMNGVIYWLHGIKIQIKISWVSLKISSFVFQRGMKIIQLWNDMTVSN